MEYYAATNKNKMLSFLIIRMKLKIVPFVKHKNQDKEIQVLHNLIHMWDLKQLILLKFRTECLLPSGSRKSRAKDKVGRGWLVNDK